MSASGHSVASPLPVRRAGPVALAIVWVFSLLLPSGTLRTRYRLEHAAELAPLDSSGRRGYLRGALLTTPMLCQVLRDNRRTDPTERRAQMKDWIDSSTWINATLRDRQKKGEVGFLIPSITFPPWLKAMWVPLTVLIVGLVLALVGPLPGLGMFMVMGGATASGGLALTVWLGK